MTTKHHRNYVGGPWIESGRTFEDLNPVDGAGLSGIGREGGLHSMNFCSELTNVCIRIDNNEVTT